MSDLFDHNETVPIGMPQWVHYRNLSENMSRMAYVRKHGPTRERLERLASIYRDKAVAAGSPPIDKWWHYDRSGCIRFDVQQAIKQHQQREAALWGGNPLGAA